jgi:hypothetical protein
MIPTAFYVLLRVFCLIAWWNMGFWDQKRTAGPLFGKKTGGAETAADSHSSVKLTVAKPEPAPPPKAASASSTTVAAPTPPPKSSGMNQAALKFDHDIACGVLVGAFDIPGMIATVEIVERTDPATKKTERTQEWLRTNDMLAILTRSYGAEKAKLSGLAIPSTASAQLRGQLTKERDEITRRLNDLREQIVCLLHSRRAYHKAKENGITILVEP